MMTRGIQAEFRSGLDLWLNTDSFRRSRMLA